MCACSHSITRTTCKLSFVHDHNSIDTYIDYSRINCLDFSDDHQLVAAGTDQSWVGVWTVDGSPLKSLTKKVEPGNHYRFYGHSGSVYSVAFSPAILPREQKVDTGPRFLLTGGYDKTIRLWSLQVWSCLIVYKGHDSPVWDVEWGPWGHYFVSASMDKTARMWSQSEAGYLRIFIGNEKDCEQVTWHPNGAYVFSGGEDKTVRMWAVANGYAVRLFTGHNAIITSLACSPSGKIIASADEKGTIILWNLTSGRLIKRMKGHTGSIWSLSWSVESTVIVSGGADGTVRVWDVDGPADASGQGRPINQSVPNTKIDASAPSSSAVGGKKKQKEVVTPDQLFAFPTKKTPVYKVKFTRMNLVIAGGCNMG